MSDEAHSWDIPTRQKALMITALFTGAFIGITNETLLATALPSIQDAFSISQSEVQWITTAFLMTNGIMIPISAFLIDRFTTRGLFLTAISLFEKNFKKMPFHYWNGIFLKLVHIYEHACMCIYCIVTINLST